MVIQAPFSTVGQADDAYYGASSGGDDSGGGGGGGGDDSAWGELQEAGSLGQGWVLAFQTSQTGGRQRWFVIRSADGQLQALNSQGQVYEAKESDTLSELPHFPNEDDARAAFQKWASENEQDDEADGEDEWGEWSRVRQVDPWWVYSRQHSTEDRAQFLIAGKKDDGSTVYLAPGASIQQEPHLYDTAQGVREALQAYFQAVQDGDVPEGQRPNGDAPSRGQVASDVKASKKGGGDLADRLTQPKVLLAGAAVVGIGYYAYQNGGILDG